MWMLVRDNAIRPEVDGTRTLAACPDSDDRGEAWLWSVRRVPEPDGGWQVRVEVDPEQVRASQDVHADGQLVELVRQRGEQIVVVAVDGTHVVADRNGPWTRRLQPGDVFVVEGEEQESLLVDPAPGASRVSVVRLTPVGDGPLRWVP